MSSLPDKGVEAYRVFERLLDDEYECRMIGNVQGDWRIAVFQWPSEIVIETQSWPTLLGAVTQATFMMALHHLKLSRAPYPDIEFEAWMKEGFNY